LIPKGGVPAIEGDLVQVGQRKALITIGRATADDETGFVCHGPRIEELEGIPREISFSVRNYEQRI